MAKIMVFIDGTWLYYNISRLGEEDFQLDFGKLPQVLADEVGKQIVLPELDVVRTYFFASYASNYDLRDDDTVQRRLDFFSMLKEEYHYELRVFPIDFKGRRLRRQDRNPQDWFEPKEKCVDISLAATMLYFAAIPYAYDIAVAVVGDQDFKPVLQHVRRLGRRVAIASIKGTCAQELSDPTDEARVKDFDIIWLDNLLPELQLKRKRHKLECQSPIHKGSKKVWTTFYPRKGQKFYCDVCRAEFAMQKQEAQKDFVSSESEVTTADTGQHSGAGQKITGKIKSIKSDRGYGFIEAADGKQYFFHLTDLQADLEFGDLKEGNYVDFIIKKDPSLDKAGAARNVRAHSG
jgi:cold shock CspA family protein